MCIRDSNEYAISNTLTLTDNNIFKIQKKLSTGAWENGLNNLAYEGPYTVNSSGGYTRVYDYGANTSTAPAKTTNLKADVRQIYRNTLNSSGQYPGPGYFEKPIYDDTGLIEINKPENVVLAPVSYTHLTLPTIYSV